MTIKKILIVDDEPLIRNFLYDALHTKYQLILAQNGHQAMEILNHQMFDLVITDMKMPIKDGLHVLKKTKELYPSLPVIIMTAFGTIENAVEAMKLGANNYIIKPFSIDAMELMIEKTHEHLALVEENQYFYHKISSAPLSCIIAKSKQMKKILKDIEKIAKSNASVFISGESGTGKEVIAQYMHYSSYRNKKPFIKVNCAAIADTLLESEFFGHEKGSFTGADYRKKGRFELADRGTLLLDEVTEIPLTLQPKLLRAIQEQEFERVGGIQPIHVDLRFISTTNRNMKEAIEKKIFRKDLYYRLNVMPIYIPPLRERKEDILPLAEAFLERFCQENHKKIKQFSSQAKEKLLHYSWPGNIRELANIIERTVVMDRSEIIHDDHLLIEEFSLAPAVNDSSLYEVEKNHIFQMLKKLNFNKTHAAKQLGISLKTLRNKIKQYNIIQKDPYAFPPSAETAHKDCDNTHTS